jgi:hypothetical protein
MKTADGSFRRPRTEREIIQDVVWKRIENAVHRMSSHLTNYYRVAVRSRASRLASADAGRTGTTDASHGPICGRLGTSPSRLPRWQHFVRDGAADCRREEAFFKQQGLS